MSKFKIPNMSADELYAWLESSPRVCDESLDWVRGKDLREAHATCPNANWVTFLVHRADGTRGFPEWDAYVQASKPAWDVYKQVAIPVYDVYSRNIQSAQETYRQAVKSTQYTYEQARDAYLQAMKLADEAYFQATRPAWNIYSQAIKDLFEVED